MWRYAESARCESNDELAAAIDVTADNLPVKLAVHREANLQEVLAGIGM